MQLVGTSNVLVAGNYIGTDKTGVVPAPNQLAGITIGTTTNPNYIGFKDDMSNADPNQFRNVISGNASDGISIINIDSLYISGNYIGVDATGNASLINTNYGIEFLNNSNNNIVGTNANGSFDAVE